MRFQPTAIPGVVLIEADVMGQDDPRGPFFEVYHEGKFAAAGLRAPFVQDNHSRSRRGTVRGMHFQHPHGQVKLVRVVSGEVFDAVVDVRRGSPTFGRAVWAVLSAENRRQLWVPAGFAHGFCVLSETADFVYKCSEVYSPADERGIRWDDPDLGIPWPVADPLLSARDERFPRLAEVDFPLPSYEG
jgi:dTDP-4-dehydrorhamnose 3,5-epimerase